MRVFFDSFLLFRHVKPLGVLKSWAGHEVIAAANFIRTKGKVLHYHINSEHYTFLALSA